MTPKDLWQWALIVVLLLSVLAFRMLPRYEYQAVQQGNAVSVVVYDRWTGRLQRAIYADNGNLNVMGVYTPF
ncbi:MAG TPA: hypothetical protein VFA59_19450 [Vicinamibacterales bacterium]|nr:hypothetical protein [Vicinamibacterales bacterium]